MNINESAFNVREIVLHLGLDQYQYSVSVSGRILSRYQNRYQSAVMPL